MPPFFDKIEILNFKSIKEIAFECSRINLFIGKPNVGKSNLIEALSLFSAPYYSDKSNFLKEFIRFQDPGNLFFDSPSDKLIRINTNLASLAARFVGDDSNQFEFIINYSEKIINDILKNLDIDKYFIQREKNNNLLFELEKSNLSNVITPLYFRLHENGITFEDSGKLFTNIKKYEFKENVKFNETRYVKSLTPPYGKNLFGLFGFYSNFFEASAELFEDYNLDLIYDEQKNNVLVQKKIGRKVYQLPFELMANTFKRIIFYTAITDINKNDIILLEEPEVHSYPPFINFLGEKISDSKENQFFITTHSPFLMESILTKSEKNEVSLFIMDYQNYESKIKKLNSSEIEEVLDLSSDIFFNIDRFINA